MSGHASLAALVGYAAWTLLLVTGIALVRSGLVLVRRRAPGAFTPDMADVSPFAARLARAHANCVENLPIFAALVVAAHLGGRPEVVDGLATAVLGARVAQSTVHLISTSSPAVLVRFAFFGVQVAIEAVWAFVLLAG